MLAKTLPENHFFLTAENDMRSICNHLLSSKGITYFNYLRVYNDGSSYLLCTHNEMVKYVFENQIPVAAPIDSKLITTNFNYFILPMGKYNKLVHHAKINWNLSHFIDLVDRHENYIDLFCFGSTPNNSEIVNFYLNNMDFLERFKNYFKEAASHLIQNAEKNKIILSDEMEPPYRGLHYQSDSNSKTTHLNNFRDLKGKYGKVMLTPRQYDCLSQIASGCTAKEAARNLGISQRTVENYLANIKSIFDCRTKSQLIRIFLGNLH